MLTESEFIEVFKPSASPSGEALWHYDEVKDKPLHNVWSIVQADNGEDQMAITGFHVVNMLGYVVTEKPWENEEVQAMWYEADSDHSVEHILQLIVEAAEDPFPTMEERIDTIRVILERYPK